MESAEDMADYLNDFIDEVEDFGRIDNLTGSFGKFGVIFSEMAKWKDAITTIGSIKESMALTEDMADYLNDFLDEVEDFSRADKLLGSVQNVTKLLSEMENWGKGGKVEIMGGKVEFTLKPNKKLEQELYSGANSMKAEMKKVNENLEKFLGNKDGNGSLKGLIKNIRDYELHQVATGSNYGEYGV